jgi:hypothetical protein
MGIGPWAQADLIRDVEKAARARFRRALSREEKYLRSLVGSTTAGGVMRGDLEGAFHRMRTAISPKPRKDSKMNNDKPKRIRV